MRVLHVFKTYFHDAVGGIEQAIYNICEYMYQNGHVSDVLTVSPADRQPESSMGNHVVYSGRRICKLASTDLSLDFFRQFQKRAAQYDIVHYHFPWPLMDCAHLLLWRGKKAVVTYHSDIVKQKVLYRLYKPLQTAFLNRMDAIVATSARYAETSPVLAQYRNKTTVIEPGIVRQDVNDVDLERVAYWKKRFPGFFFLFVGALRYYKGLHFLIDAARRTGLTVVVAGQGGDEARLRKILADTPAETVHLVGGISNKDRNALLQLCGCFVLPSHLRSEAFGLALLEAMHFAKPLITCEIGTGTSFVNQDNVTGIVVPPCDVDALAVAMNTLAGDAETARRMGEAAEKRLAENFTVEAMGRKYLDLYQSLV